MKEKLEQVFEHLKERIAQKKLAFNLLALIVGLWAIAGMLGMLVLDKVFESPKDFSGFKTSFTIWAVVLVPLIVILAFKKCHIEKLESKLKKTKKKLNLLHFLDVFEKTTDSEEKEKLVEKILKEVD